MGECREVKEDYGTICCPEAEGVRDHGATGGWHYPRNLEPLQGSSLGRYGSQVETLG
jgi:hypothetical protein